MLFLSSKWKLIIKNWARVTHNKNKINPVLRFDELNISDKQKNNMDYNPDKKENCHLLS